MHPVERYRALVTTGQLTGDPAQERVAAALEALSETLRNFDKTRTPLFAFSKQKTKPKGIYIFGPVGRGKSMLMDLFFEEVEVKSKQRIHFHDFMSNVHISLKRLRDAGAGDPIVQAAREITQKARLLCFDEFQVMDIADAMILGRLFSELFDQGVVIVATSNRAPGELYENGINRQLFIPAINLISRNMEILKLDGPIDYRLARLERSPVYFVPLGKQADEILESIWFDLTGTHTGTLATIEVMGRTLAVQEQVRGVARFEFQTLCGAAMGPQDFLAIADTFHAVVLKSVPLMSPANRNEAKRFTTLVDALYERSAKLIMSAEAEPMQLYKAGDGAFEFQRTSSRLIEMQTPEYLAKRHQPRTSHNLQQG